jgi:hypothetical protein
MNSPEVLLPQEDRYEYKGSYRYVHKLGDTRYVFKQPKEELDIVDSDGIIEVNSDAASIVQFVSDQLNDESLKEVVNRLREGDISTQDLRLIDSIIAAVSIADNLSPSDVYLPEGLADFVEALAGDSIKQQIIDNKLKVLYELEEQNDAKRTAFMHESPESHTEVKEISADQIILSHSTSHEVEVRTDGSVVLRPAAEYREDISRSTIHFSPNSLVSSHMMGEWGHGNTIILCNLKSIIDANNGKLPANGNDVDTYFALSPGEELVLKDAVVIEGLPPDASEEERRNHTAKIKNIMLKMGAYKVVESGPHYSNDQDFQKEYYKLMVSLGVKDCTLHANTMDAFLETAYSVPEYFSNDKLTYSSALIQTKRFMALHGLYPVYKKVPEPSGMFL